MRKGLMLFLFFAAAVGASAQRPDVAAQGTAWFGTPGPAPLSDPRKPVMKYDDAFPPLPARFTPRPGKPDESITAFDVRADG